MLHLPADRLAELVDNEPTPQELAHLQGCAVCARERAALLALRDLAAAEGSRAGAPLLAWEDLRGSLAAEGIISPTVAESRPALKNEGTAKRRFWASHWSLRAAASLTLLAGGAFFGRATAPQGEAGPAGSGIAVEQPSNAEPAGFVSAEDAMTALLRAQEDYQRAAAFLLASDTTLGPSTPTLYKQRLAALDELMGVSRSALTRSPHDPVINGYYLAALGAREATIQQLELALPEGTRIDRF